MENRFCIEKYAKQCIQYCIDLDFTPRTIIVLKYLLKNIIFDEQKQVAICICQQDEMKKETHVSRVTISKSIHTFLEMGLFIKKGSIVFLNLNFLKQVGD